MCSLSYFFFQMVKIEPSMTFLKIQLSILKIVDSHAIVRNDTERSHITFTPFPPMVSSCKTVIQHHSKEYLHHYKKPPCCPLGLFSPSAQFCVDSSRLLYVSTVHSFLLLSSVPHYRCFTISLIIHLGCFQFLSVMNKAVINIHVQIVV